jgi:hypothetical protein
MEEEPGAADAGFASWLEQAWHDKAAGDAARPGLSRAGTRGAARGLLSPSGSPSSPGSPLRAGLATASSSSSVLSRGSSTVGGGSSPFSPGSARSGSSPSGSPNASRGAASANASVSASLSVSAGRSSNVKSSSRSLRSAKALEGGTHAAMAAMVRAQHKAGLDKKVVPKERKAFAGLARLAVEALGDAQAQLVAAAASAPDLLDLEARGERDEEQRDEAHDAGQLGPVGLAALLDAGWLARLARLALPGNRVGVEGMVLLARLTAQGALRELCLSSNDLAAPAVLAFCGAFAQDQHCRLLTLDLAWNDIGAEGAEALSSALGHFAPELRVLRIQGNAGLGARGAAALAALLRATTTLLSLDLRETGLSPRDARLVLEEGLAYNHSLVATRPADPVGARSTPCDDIDVATSQRCEVLLDRTRALDALPRHPAPLRTT